MVRKLHEPGKLDLDPYLSIGPVLKEHSASIKHTLYQVHWHCHNEDAVLTHQQITKRKSEAQRHGLIGPCYACSRGLKLGVGGRGPLHSQQRSEKADRQRQGWLQVAVGRAWPKPAGIVLCAVWGTQY
jgi:hypothetical protein